MISLPYKPRCITSDQYRGEFIIEGLHPGYGQTIGNSLRRILLSSLKGAAITSIKIDGVGHEFSTISGVLEDVVEIMLNFKQLRFRLLDEGPFTIVLDKKGVRKISGGDFDMPSQVEIMNKEAHIATLTAKDAKLRIEATVEAGLGYVPVEARTKEKVEVGTIALDAAFSPVRHVNYEVENMRVGDRTDYNLVRIEIETDGSISPDDAFQTAASILVKQFEVIASGFDRTPVREHTPAEFPQYPTSDHVAAKKNADEHEGGTAETEEDATLRIKLDELKISNRVLNVLRESGIKTVGGLTRKREETLRQIEGLGDKGIQEIKKAMGNFGITLRP